MRFIFLGISRKETYWIHKLDTLHQGSSKDGPDPFCEKTVNVLLKWTLFLAGPHIQAIQISCQLCSNVDTKDSWANQILQRAHINFKWPINIWKFACI